MPPKAGKKGNKDGKGSGGSATWTLPKTIINPEHHHTLNHLDQVSSFYAAIASVHSPTEASHGKQSSSRVAASSRAMQAHLRRDMQSLSKKALIRMDRSLKRPTCPRCSSLAVPGLTARTRNKASGPHDHIVANTCLVCNAKRRIPAPNAPRKTRPNRNPKAAPKFDQQDPTNFVVVRGVGKNGMVGPVLP
ncbi:hypothetical protein BCV70DRAFT_215267 [Testicularia cyperi]|uniref:Rpr2-domain-containing protein n=1 Tax=Testicularia cyperi TaxID=1882483 RepID=A0A317XU83_9BASI|nr:hypothetical protein BCV70DRAFT_215267 [Testicularia cyperi]